MTFILRILLNSILYGHIQVPENVDILSALSGSRQVYIAKQEKKYEWLKQLHERIMDYKTMRGRFLSNDFGEYDRDDFIYDMRIALGFR